MGYFIHDEDDRKPAIADPVRRAAWLRAKEREKVRKSGTGNLESRSDSQGQCIPAQKPEAE
jgi:hypothetical protein